MVFSAAHPTPSAILDPARVQLNIPVLFPQTNPIMRRWKLARAGPPGMYRQRKIQHAAFDPVFAAIVMVIILFSNAPAGHNQHLKRTLYGLRIGVLAHDVDHFWSRSRAEGGVDMNAEVVFNQPSFSILTGRLLPNVGASINSQKDTSKLYGGFIWEFLIGPVFL